MNKAERYNECVQSIEALIAGEEDWIAVLSTVVCELHHRFDHFHWTGFYRVMTGKNGLKTAILKVGPYQGGHGCLTIPFHRGVCGAAARTGEVQRIGDVRTVTDHIACSTSTLSEIVLPVFDQRGEVCAVLDIDSDFPDAFDEVDELYLSRIAGLLRPYTPQGTPE